MRFKQVLHDSDVRILLKIAEKGERTQNQLLEEKIICSNTTAGNSLKKLEYLNLVKSRLDHEQYIKGRKSSYYSLTLNGLLLSIHFWKRHNRNLFNHDWDKIAKKYKKLLPLVFDKWDFFSKNNLKEEAIARLLGAVISIQSKVENNIEFRYEYMHFLEKKFGKKFVFSMVGKKMDNWLKSFDDDMSAAAKEVGLEWQNVRSRSLRIYESITKLSEETFAELLKKSFFFGSSDVMIDPKKETEFLKTIIKDKELKDYVINYLTETEKRYEDFLKNIRSWKRLVSI